MESYAVQALNECNDGANVIRQGGINGRPLDHHRLQHRAEELLAELPRFHGLPYAGAGRSHGRTVISNINE